MKRLAILIGLLLPFSASALEYRNLSLYYTDAPFNPAEAAGISLLTSLNAVSGYPDGTFRPNRTVNRAEFLKIVLASYAKVRVSPSDADNCFPDVHKEDWFSQYVCLAKKRGMISGYPDGSFKPERSVNYAEALKILSELYKMVAYSAPDEEWYAGYVRAAEITKTALPASLKYDRLLTRGQMARLAAAYRAYDEGELETYRLAEKNLDLVIAQEIAQNAQSSSASSSSSSSVKQIVYTFPAKSQFLVLGSTRLIASGFIQPRSEAVTVKNVTVKLRSKSENIAEMYLVDAYGNRIAPLKLDIYDNEDLTWKSFGDLPAHSIQSAGKTLGIEVVTKSMQQGGVPDELVQVKWMSMNVAPIGMLDAYQVIATDTSYPPQQTAEAEITSVRNNRPAVLDVGQGDSVLLGEWEISGTHLDGAELRVQHLAFTIAQRSGIILSNFSLGSFDSTKTTPCSTEGALQINCLNIPADIGTIEHDSILVQLWGTVDVDETAQNPHFKIDIAEPGVLGTATQDGVLGSVRWSDGQGSYTWVDLPAPLAEGSTWK